MSNVYETLLERGFIQQVTHEDKIKELLKSERVSFYIGFDPTADSLHIGHFLTIMSMAHMQRAGHMPIVLLGGGTAMIGDPTDKTEMRRIMTKEEIDKNVNCFKGQLSRFINFENDNAIILNNAEWLLSLNYIDFLRECGIHFSVNRMLTADCYKTRLEKGLSFLEFNYMLMQSYDFLKLNRRYNCKLQIGGNDQWSNIIGGIELIRRAENKQAYGMTLSLLTTGDNKKMGKTEKGALWLDPLKTSPYEFFQYFRNTADDDVNKFLRLLTFLPMSEINELNKLQGSEINRAKEILAFELTKTVHGVEEANKALNASNALFKGAEVSGSIPTTLVSLTTFGEKMNIIDALELVGLISTKSEGRRLVLQGGIKVNGLKVDTIDFAVRKEINRDGIIVIQKGKKVFHHLKLI